MHAARGHALVRGIDDDADSARLQHILDGIGDLGGQFLLDLQPAGISPSTRASLLMPTTRFFGR